MYNIKIYEIDWTYKFTLNLKKLKNELSFTANTKSWQWQAVLNLDLDFDYSQINTTDIIKVYLDTILIYTWIVQNIYRKITNNYQEIELPLLWLWTLTNYLLYKDTWVYEFTKTQDPADTIRDIIDYVNTIYPNWLFYDWTSIIDYWTSFWIDFENETCFSALQKVTDTTNYYLFIDKDWKVYFKPKESTPTHKLTVWKDVESISFQEDSEKLVNKLVLEYKTWTKTYEDATSQTTYWIRELYLVKTDLVDVTSADEFWDNYILENKNPINKTQIVVNKNFNIESIKINDTIIVKNFSFDIDNLIIVKYSYTNDKIKIDLEEFDSFWKELNL